MAILKLAHIIGAASAGMILSASAFAQGPGAVPAAQAPAVSSTVLAPVATPDPASGTTSLKFDTPTTVNEVTAVCTGVGDSDESNPPWTDYPVKVVTAGKDGQWLGGATITIKSGGKDLATVGCGGPWTLFKVSPGRYEVTATIQDESKSGVVFAKQGSQGRVILRFLNRGGAVSAQHVPATQ